MLCSQRIMQIGMRLGSGLRTAFAVRSEKANRRIALSDHAPIGTRAGSPAAGALCKRVQWLTTAKKPSEPPNRYCDIGHRYCCWLNLVLPWPFRYGVRPAYCSLVGEHPIPIERPAYPQTIELRLRDIVGVHPAVLRMLEKYPPESVVGLRGVSDAAINDVYQITANRRRSCPGWWWVLGLERGQGLSAFG